MIRDKDFYKTLLFIALPVAFQNLITFGVNMLDTIMVGSLGEISMSSVALANQISTFMMMFVRGVSGGTSVLISQYWGKKDLSRIKTVFGIGFTMSLGVSTLATLLIMAFPANIMSFFTNDPQIIATGAGYLRIVCFSYIFYAVSDTFVAMLRCVEVVKVALLVSIFSFFVNVGSNYVLIFGKLGFPAMGVNGAAFATVFTRLLEISVVIIYVVFFNKKFRFHVREIVPNQKYLWADFFKYGAPIILGDVLWGFVGVMKSAIIGRLTPEAIAANSITEVVLQLATVFIFGLGGAGCVVIGKCVGAKDYVRTRQYSNTLQILFFSIGFLAAVFTFCIRDLAISFYSVSDVTKQLAREFLLYGAITIWGTGYAAACFTGINRGAGDASFVVKTDLFFGWCVVLPAAFIALKMGAPAPIVFFCTRCDQILKMFVAFFRLRGNKWIRNVTRD